jgi:penicillin-binding protein 1A
MKVAEASSNGNGRSSGSTLTLLAIALLLALSAGALTGLLASYYLNNSRYSVEVSALATYRPPQVTTIYADDGETVLAEFAIEKRIPIKIQDVPVQVTDALNI